MSENSRRNYRIELNLFEGEKKVYSLSETLQTETVAGYISPVVDRLVKRLKFLIVKEQ